MEDNKPWFVYMLWCRDQTIYTGITTDITRRLDEHNGKINPHKGAKYTLTRQPVILKYCKKFKNRSLAAKEEQRIKQLARIEKMALIEYN